MESGKDKSWNDASEAVKSTAATIICSNKYLCRFGSVSIEIIRLATTGTHLSIYKGPAMNSDIKPAAARLPPFKVLALLAS
jgi:hypothetical protein